MRRLQLVLRAIERAAHLPDVIELEDGLNFLGAFSRLHEDESEDLSPREHNLGVCRDLG